MRLLPLIGITLSLLVRGQEAASISPLQRMAFARVLIPADPGGRIQARLPQTRILSEAELANTFREMKQGAYLGVVGWKDLTANFALRGRVAEARECLAEARKKENFETDAGLFDAWFIEMSGDYRKALAAFEELIADFPAEVILQQRRTGCLAALYRPLAAKQGLEVVESMAKDQAAWLEHMRGVIAVLENDLEQAHVHFLQAVRKADKTPLPHSAAGMALLYRNGQSMEESIGWLKKAMTGPDRRYHQLLINQPIWKPLWEQPLFQEAVAQSKWPFFPEGVPGEAAGAEGAGQVVSQVTLPEGYTVPLKLQQHEPGTRTRTLTGKLNLELYNKEE